MERIQLTISLQFPARNVRETDFSKCNTNSI